MGFIGSRWVPGPGEPLTAPTRVGSQIVSPPTSPAMIGIEDELMGRLPGSQGKKPGEWRGSTYIGPQLNNIAAASEPAGPLTPPPVTPPPVTPPYRETITPGMSKAEIEAMGIRNNTTLSDEEKVALGGNSGAGGDMPIASPVVTPTTTMGVSSSQAPPGFEQSKWNDTNQGTSHKYVGGRILSRAGADPDDVLKDPKFAGWTTGADPNDDLITSPEGSIYDVMYDYGGSNQRPQWQYKSGGPVGPRNDGIPGNDPNGGRTPSGIDSNDPRLHDGIPGNAGTAGTTGTTSIPSFSVGSGGNRYTPPTQIPYNSPTSDPSFFLSHRTGDRYTPPESIPYGTQYAPPTAPFPTANVIQSLSGPSGFFRGLPPEEADPWMAELMARAVNRRR